MGSIHIFELFNNTRKLDNVPKYSGFYLEDQNDGQYKISSTPLNASPLELVGVIRMQVVVSLSILT